MMKNDNDLFSGGQYENGTLESMLFDKNFESDNCILSRNDRVRPKFLEIDIRKISQGDWDNWKKRLVDVGEQIYYKLYVSTMKPTDGNELCVNVHISNGDDGVVCGSPYMSNKLSKFYDFVDGNEEMYARYSKIIVRVCCYCYSRYYMSKLLSYVESDHISDWEEKRDIAIRNGTVESFYDELGKRPQTLVCMNGSKKDLYFIGFESDFEKYTGFRNVRGVRDHNVNGFDITKYKSARHMLSVTPQMLKRFKRYWRKAGSKSLRHDETTYAIGMVKLDCIGELLHSLEFERMFGDDCLSIDRSYFMRDTNTNRIEWMGLVESSNGDVARTKTVNAKNGAMLKCIRYFKIRDNIDNIISLEPRKMNLLKSRRTSINTLHESAPIMTSASITNELLSLASAIKMTYCDSDEAKRFEILVANLQPVDNFVIDNHNVSHISIDAYGSKMCNLQHGSNIEGPVIAIPDEKHTVRRVMCVGCLRTLFDKIVPAFSDFVEKYPEYITENMDYREYPAYLNILFDEIRGTDWVGKYAPDDGVVEHVSEYAINVFTKERLPTKEHEIKIDSGKSTVKPINKKFNNYNPTEEELMEVNKVSVNEFEESIRKVRAYLFEHSSDDNGFYLNIDTMSDTVVVGVPNKAKPENVIEGGDSLDITNIKTFIDDRTLREMTKSEMVKSIDEMNAKLATERIESGTNDVVKIARPVFDSRNVILGYNVVDIWDTESIDDKSYTKFPKVLNCNKK